MEAWLGIHDTSEMSDQNEEKRYTVDRVLIHQDFDDVYYDIALVKLARRIVFTPEIAPICLPLTEDFPDRTGKVIQGPNYTRVCILS